MKIKLMALIIHLLYLPLSLYFTYRLLQYVKAPEFLWFLFWFMIPFAIAIGILERLAEWEED